MLMDINALVTNVSASTTSARNPIPLLGATTVSVSNHTSAIAYVDSGDSTVVATTSMVGINPGQTESFTINPTHSHVAAILSTGTGNVQFRFSIGGE